MSLAIRLAHPKEATGLLEASHALMLSLYPPEDCYFLDIEQLCVPSIRFFVSSHVGQDIGCIALANKGDYGEVKSMFVDPAARGTGTGAALVSHLIKDAKAQGLTALKLETGDTLVAAHRLYSRHGFTICDPFGDYNEGPHSIFMERNL